MAAVQKYSALHMMLCVLATTQLWVPSDNVTVRSILSGMMVDYSSKRFIQSPILVVLHVSSTLGVGNPTNSVDVF